MRLAIVLLAALALAAPAAVAYAPDAQGFRHCVEVGLHDVCVYRENGAWCVWWWSGMPPAVLHCFTLRA